MTWNLRQEYKCKDYPSLKHYYWTKESKTPPSGIIGVHRLIKEECKPIASLLILPGTWSSGEQLSANTVDDDWKRNEDIDEPFFWANRCIDVYLMDYRTHFLSPEKDPSEFGFMVDWGWEQWINDIKEVVEFIKEISSFKRVFLAGESFGGLATVNFATLFPEDLESLILLDGGPILRQPTNSLDFDGLLEKIKNTKSWAMEVGGTKGALFLFKYIDKNPNAPPTNPVTGEPLEPRINPITGEKWNNILEWATFTLYSGWGPGLLTNVYAGYNDPRVLVHTMSTFDRYWPIRIYLETQTMLDWKECPYLKYDFDNMYSKISLPILDIISGFGLSAGRLSNNPFPGNRPYSMILLEKYGHLDVYNGSHCKVDVSIPVVSAIYSRVYKTQIR
ncbi:alpha/beta hydrolase [Sulfolobus acidocaldarius]|uniref:Serine aminopeptidase S33 domain-containing protein n=4 Tax=Sulfolobus acidocaldarius TaxID=2285 RepID=Q4J9S3_SULAC|nr:alpha/beta hydrolase [Sulfolobus acidocaldarius]AAY80458.1 hypothetical protein Saci_1106 [Sulfolobus acidocaldarius DSM 639]AGE71043.1 hypothetical protein SacN8_05380 [Sulfolobus acidocaldarius N8]AGE73314.1 hypothetical protein SacRon12I_05370 [Sulfolobus acidocaldarius Ron12/I]ALU28666.1 hypothetical protein ATY89_00960 [Sulfolobus acidocaldarius]ALU31382.1 hypothetical protein ATZ20_03995 [Sulfolobus acidocaldarius]